MKSFVAPYFRVSAANIIDKLLIYKQYIDIDEGPRVLVLAHI